MRTFLKKHTELILLGGIILAGLLLRLNGLYQFCLNGDEFASLDQANTLGLNYNGILYFFLLKLWMYLGEGETWYRILSVLLSLPAIPLAYWVGRQAGSSRMGLIFATLVAISPFSVQLSQLIRNYCLLISMSVFALGSTIYFIKNQDKIRWVYLAAAMLLMPLTHLLGSIFVFVMLISLYLFCGKFPKNIAWRAVLVATLLIILCSIVLIPALRALVWPFFQKIIMADVFAYQAPRGLSLTILAKIPVAFYLFLAGGFVYPLKWWLTLPLAGFSIYLAVNAINHQKQYFPLVLMMGLFIMAVPAAFILLDSITPPQSQNLGAHHVAMFLPTLLFLLSLGIDVSLKNKKWVGVCVSGLFGITLLVSGFMRNVNDWRYTFSTAPDWRKIEAITKQYEEDELTIAIDKRAIGAMDYYAKTYTQVYLIDDLVKAMTPHLLYLSTETRDTHLSNANPFPDIIDHYYSPVKTFSDFPLIGIIYELRVKEGLGYRIDPQSGQVVIPIRGQGMAYESVITPFVITVNGADVELTGAFGLSNDYGDLQRVIPLEAPFNADAITVIFTSIDSAGLNHGDLMAKINIETTSGETFQYPILYGVHVTDWENRCQPDSACESVYTWQKTITLTGQYTYPKAWQHFTAAMHQTEFMFPASAISRILFTYPGNTGSLDIWGVVLHPAD